MYLILRYPEFHTATLLEHISRMNKVLRAAVIVTKPGNGCCNALKRIRDATHNKNQLPLLVLILLLTNLHAETGIPNLHCKNVYASARQELETFSEVVRPNCFCASSLRIPYYKKGQSKENQNRNRD